MLFQLLGFCIALDLLVLSLDLQGLGRKVFLKLHVFAKRSYNFKKNPKYHIVLGYSSDSFVLR